MEIFCKVCNAEVPQRRNYRPSVCEACKKFFFRNSRRKDKLICSAGGRQCEIYANKSRICSYCRFTKCLKVGMKFRLKGRSRASSNTSSAAASSSGSSVHESPREIVCYNGSTIENLLRNAVQSYAILHDFDYLGFKSHNAHGDDANSFWTAGTQSLKGACEIGLKCSHFIAERLGVNEGELKILVPPFLLTLNAIYTSMPTYTQSGAQCFGMSQSAMTKMVQLYPGFAETKKACDNLQRFMKEWNPSIIEASLLIFFFFFKKGRTDVGYNRIRHQIALAVNLIISKMYDGDEQAIENRRIDFSKAIDMIVVTVASLLRSTNAMARITPEFTLFNPLFKEIFLSVCCEDL